MEKPIESFEEFWPIYVREHSRKLTRRIHFISTSAALACVAGGLLTRHRWLLLAAPVVAYGPAWLSHLLVEHNLPTTFRHPLWSIKADLIMWRKTIQGSMDEEVESILGEEAEETDPHLRPNMATDNTLH
jgi:hypothetical protein